jgi:AcrR family transcriptional regulator
MILAAAFELVEVDGLAGLTMRRLADRLGVAPMAAYRHFADRGALIDAMLEDAGTRIELPTASAGDWQGGITELAQALRVGLRRHPGLVEALVARPAIGSATIRLGEAAYGYLLDAGFPPDTMERAVNLVYGFVVGFVALEAPRRRALTADLFQEQAAVQAAYQAVDPEELPHTARVAPRVERFFDDEQFAFGLAAILGGLQAQREAPAGA